MDSENSHRQVNLVQYRRLNDRWQFVPVGRKNGKPDPRLILIHGEPTRSKGGHFYLAWREDGKLKRKAVGSYPSDQHTYSAAVVCDVLEAWAKRQWY